jgi:hypothetical protein
MSVRVLIATALSIVLLVALADAAGAEAAKIGAGGKIQACYKTKGKAKGALRVVTAAKQCKRRRAERPLSWSVTGGTVSTSNEDVLALLGLVVQQQQRIDSLSSELESLQGVLAGVTNGDLTGVLSKLSGISGADLQSVVDSLPAIDSLCTQLSTVTSRVDALRTVIGGLGLNGVLTALGGVLNIPALPAALGAYSCPS